jgi:NAD(P)-dependent dehydrogenase (short-subunit alcohol dehydrogenase family)
VSSRTESSVALVTGAGSGVGLALVRELVARGAPKVYAAVRDPSHVDPELTGLVAQGVEVVPLDITDPAQVAAAAAHCSDVSLLVNNAGYASTQRLVFPEDPDAARREMEVNYFGTLAMIRAFAPVLAANGGGWVANVLSVTATIAFPVAGGYSASKAAALFLTTCARAELAGQGTGVTALILGSVDTKMASHVTGPKHTPQEIALSSLFAVDKGIEVHDTDPMAVAARASYAKDPGRYQRAMARQLESHQVRVGSGSTTRPYEE